MPHTPDDTTQGETAPDAAAAPDEAEQGAAVGSAEDQAASMPAGEPAADAEPIRHGLAAPHEEETRRRAVDAAIEAMERDASMSATAAANLAGDAHGCSGRSVTRWAQDQGRPLTSYGRTAQVGAAVQRAAVYDLNTRRSQRARLAGLIDRELDALEGEPETEDRSARLQRLAGAHARLTETQHRDDLHGMRIGDPDALTIPHQDADDDDMPPNVADIGDAMRRARAD
ncbi:MAG: hypothetical protein WC211_03845 [Dehalococcoidia bacterium]